MSIEEDEIMMAVLTAPTLPITVPTYDELMWPTLRALKAMGGSGTNEEVLANVIEQERFSADVQALQHTDN